MDQSKPNWKGQAITESSELQVDNKLTYFEGNCHIIADYLRAKLGREPRVAFHGDQYASDVHWSNAQKGWDGIAVVEEMCIYEEEFKHIEANTALTPLDMQHVST